MKGPYHAIRWIIGLALGFYFRRIETFHSDRVPAVGPVLFTSNHPNSLADSLGRSDSMGVGATGIRSTSTAAGGTSSSRHRAASLPRSTTRCGMPW